MKRTASIITYIRVLAVTIGLMAAIAGLLMWAPAKTAAPQDKTCTTCKPLRPADDQRCAQLESQLSQPGQFVSRGQAQLDKYEPLMAEFMEKLCYRAWKHDTTARDTGPYTATLVNGQLKAQAYNQHAVSRVCGTRLRCSAGWSVTGRPMKAWRHAILRLPRKAP